MSSMVGGCRCLSQIFYLVQRGKNEKGALRCPAMSTGARSKTVVTVISKIAEKPVGKDACLVVIYGLELGRKYNLENANIIIGRSSKSDVQIDQESVSRNHAKIINT